MALRPGPPYLTAPLPPCGQRRTGARPAAPRRTPARPTAAVPALPVRPWARRGDAAVGPTDSARRHRGPPDGCSGPGRPPTCTSPRSRRSTRLRSRRSGASLGGTPDSAASGRRTGPASPTPKARLAVEQGHQSAALPSYHGRDCNRTGYRAPASSQRNLLLGPAFDRIALGTESSPVVRP